MPRLTEELTLTGLNSIIQYAHLIAIISSIFIEWKEAWMGSWTQT